MMMKEPAALNVEVLGIDLPDEAAGVAEFSFAPLEPLLRKREESGRFGAGECDIKKPAFLFQFGEGNGTSESGREEVFLEAYDKYSIEFQSFG